MKISVYFSVLFLALVIKIATVNAKQMSPQQYCGSRLADIMKVICSKNNDSVRNKKMASELMDYKDTEDNYNGLDYYSYRPSQEGMTFIPSRFLRSKSKIINECCEKPCYITELQSYCFH